MKPPDAQWLTIPGVGAQQQARLLPAHLHIHATKASGHRAGRRRDDHETLVTVDQIEDLSDDRLRGRPVQPMRVVDQQDEAGMTTAQSDQRLGCRR